MSETKEIKSPLKAIRAFCIECMGGQTRLVADCPSKNCPLLPFRMGHNPFSKRELTDEQRAELSERAKNMFGQKN